MVLADILPDAVYVSGPLSVPVKGIAYDSRKVVEGGVFIAMKGQKTDGHHFIGDAVQRGARAVVFETGADVARVRVGEGNVTWIGVSDSREALACLAHRYYRRPSERMEVIGVTGTNGKTTTTYVLKSILEAWGKKVGLIGTISSLIGGDARDAFHTTPEAPEFQELLREMAEAQCSHVVTEVSSHALVQHRVDYTVFRACIFTNLSRDHLDYHGSMERYFAAKERLFTEVMPQSGIALVNSDDPYGQRLAARLQDMGRPAVCYGISDRRAEVRAGDIRSSAKGTRFVLDSGKGSAINVFTPLLGRVNVYNSLAAAAAALAQGVPVSHIVQGIERAGAVKGRFERIETRRGFLAVVDYAHTEDALERLIMTARELVSSHNAAGASQSGTDITAFDSAGASGRGRVITVFGCGGDRDKGKRPGMGGVASRLSDLAIVTSDNPRSEDPREIIRDIERGVSGDDYLVIPDRETAIRTAVDLAGPGDVLLVAGKGHEEHQEIQGTRRPFSDRVILEQALKGERR